MEKAREFDDRQSLAIPVDHLLAVIRDRDEEHGIIKALNESGFAPDEIGLLSGPQGTAKLDAVCGKKGFFAKLVTAGVDLGDRDSDYIKEYRTAVLNGQTVIAVAAKDDDSRDRARQILKTRGARFITFFGRFVTQVLEA